MTVSIIILSYNTKDLLKACIKSVEKYVKTSYEIIVVDNDSTDDSVSMVKEEFPNVRVIENKENVGFGKGANQGAMIAKGEYLLFLNSDAEFVDDSLQQMTQFAGEHEEVGIVGGKTGKQRSFGKFLTLPHVFLLLYAERFIGKQESSAKTMQKTDWVSGGFMLIKRSVFKQINGFDDHIFMYIEDMELCFRVKQAGYDTYFSPQAQVKHLGQGSSSRSFAIIHIFQGLAYFYHKHKSHRQYLIVKNMLKLKALFAIFLGTVTGNQYLKSTYKKALLFI